jgi:hypothetical protein
MSLRTWLVWYWNMTVRRRGRHSSGGPYHWDNRCSIEYCGWPTPRRYR